MCNACEPYSTLTECQNESTRNSSAAARYCFTYITVKKTTKIEWKIVSYVGPPISSVCLQSSLPLSIFLLLSFGTEAKKHPHRMLLHLKMKNERKNSKKWISLAEVNFGCACHSKCFACRLCLSLYLRPAFCSTVKAKEQNIASEKENWIAVPCAYPRCSIHIKQQWTAHHVGRP